MIDGQNLLADNGFVGLKGSIPKKSPDGPRANELAGILDLYNNGTLCAAP
jgi:hypothetical protein